MSASFIGTIDCRKETSIINPNLIKYSSWPKPLIRYSVAEQVKKGEDLYHIIPSCKNGFMEFDLFCIFDGHNGVEAAAHCKKNLLNGIFQHLSDGMDKDKWLRELPLAMAESFMHCNSTFARTGERSGTTATMVIIAGWTVTVAGVGDSRAILHTDPKQVLPLTVDHRFDTCVEEVERVSSEGGTIARLKTFEGMEVGPLRSWPGGLCVSRSIGDIDCGPSITPLPHVKQIEVPRTGGRVIVASDGLWDVIDSEQAAKLCGGMPASSASKTLVKEAIKVKGLRDDVTVIVIDLLPSDTSPSDQNACPVSKSNSKTWNKLKSMMKPKTPKQEEELMYETPNLVNDHDSLKGGNFYERYLKGESSIHSAGSFCSVCGDQITQQGKFSESSVRAGNAFCTKHRA